VKSCAEAKIFGAPFASAFRSSAETLANLNATPWVVKTVTVVMIAVMTATTFITQRQLMARNSAGTPMAQQQKILLYVLPFTFAIFGINFPVGVLLYWVTTNFWTMGQQLLVINRMNLGPAGAAGGPATKGGSDAARPGKAPAGTAVGVSDGDGSEPGGSAGDPAAGNGQPTARPAGQRPPANRNRNRKRNRRGGRR